MRKTTWGWLAAGVAAAAAIAVVVYEERKKPAATTTSAPASSGSGLVFKPSAAGGGWGLQQVIAGTGGFHLAPLKVKPTPPRPSVTIALSTSSPMTTSALAGQVVAVVIPEHFDLTQITALSQPAPIDSAPTIPAGVGSGQGGAVLLTLTGYAGDVIFSGVDPDGTEFSALLHLTGFGKP